MQYAIDYLNGKDMYRQGKRRTQCANDAQREGWDDAYAEGANSYLRAMMMADADGDIVHWGDVYEVAGIEFNAYGDRV